MPRLVKEQISSILKAAGSTRPEINHMCGHYNVVASNIRQRVVGWYGHVKEVHSADIVAVHLMINWLDQRLEQIEQQLAKITENREKNGH